MRLPGQSNKPGFPGYVYFTTFHHVSASILHFKHNKKGLPKKTLSIIKCLIKHLVSHTYREDLTNRMNNVHVIYNERYQCQSHHPLSFVMEF
jgi:hypothetical protein